MTIAIRFTATSVVSIVILAAIIAIDTDIAGKYTITFVTTVAKVVILFKFRWVF